MRTEGVYTYFCPPCELLFAVVSRFSVKSDYKADRKCPKCGLISPISGEGYVNHQPYTLQTAEKATKGENAEESKEKSYPEYLTGKHVSEFLGISYRYAYELMERKDFPLIRVGKSKRVNKHEFFDWVEKQRQ